VWPSSLGRHQPFLLRCDQHVTLRNGSYTGVNFSSLMGARYSTSSLTIVRVRVVSLILVVRLDVLWIAVVVWRVVVFVRVASATVRRVIRRSGTLCFCWLRDWLVESTLSVGYARVRYSGDDLLIFVICRLLSGRSLVNAIKVESFGQDWLILSPSFYC